MPYKDKQKQKEWHHNAYLRKRAGLPTRTTPILTIEEKNKRKQYWRAQGLFLQRLPKE